MESSLCPPHFWLIGPAEGPESPGVCKHCSQVQRFQNSFDADQNSPGVNTFNKAEAAPVVRYTPRGVDSGRSSDRTVELAERAR